ncbi:hypothetical protein L3Q82_006089 [Scortum barcoo]|uniref:Uncharacterized protein n=1 Tax=Scortum barcoo TaxID=214431 RepID=A0ACB8X2Q8_9TELE|nr:hypothetical protein L3Q82_006089 [Scortum barcoo]
MSHREEASGKTLTRWRDYVSRLAWERLGIPPEELEEVSGGCGECIHTELSCEQQPQPFKSCWHGAIGFPQDTKARLFSELKNNNRYLMVGGSP